VNRGIKTKAMLFDAASERINKGKEGESFIFMISSVVGVSFRCLLYRGKGKM
jgi:hypothetical protein